MEWNRSTSMDDGGQKYLYVDHRLGSEWDGMGMGWERSGNAMHTHCVASDDIGVHRRMGQDGVRPVEWNIDWIVWKHHRGRDGEKETRRRWK